MTLDDLLEDRGFVADIASRCPSLQQESPRLNAQCRAILARLREGPASNVELSGMALNYTARISDLRRTGFTIACVGRDRKAGTSWYELKLVEE